MKCQNLLSLKKKIECRLLQILLGALRVKPNRRYAILACAIAIQSVVCANSEGHGQILLVLAFLYEAAYYSVQRVCLIDQLTIKAYDSV